MNEHFLSIVQIICDRLFILMGNLEDWNVEAQIAIFLFEVIILFLFWPLFAPICDYYNLSTELLSVLSFLLERAATSLQENKVIFQVICVIRVEI